MIRYWAQLVSDDRDGGTLMSDNNSRREAADAYARLLFDESGGSIATGVIRVWEDATYAQDATHYAFKIAPPHHLEIKEHTT